MKYVRIAFYVSLTLFLAKGAVLVLAQAGGVAAIQPQLVIDLNKYLGPSTFMMSTLCAIFAFILSYSEDPAMNDDAA